MLRVLRCPSCGTTFTSWPGPGRSIGCLTGHVVDLARQGSLSLAGGAKLPAGDTAGMVAARQEFLAAGHYASISDAVARVVAAHAPAGVVLDVGGGTGQHLARVLEENPDRVGICLDTSTPAVHRAARAHPRIAAVAADAWKLLPVQDGTAAAVLGIFAPRNPDEVRRVLAPGGIWVVVTPRPEHQQEIVGPLGLLTVDPRKDERLEAEFVGFSKLDEQDVVEVREFTRAQLRTLVLMGPSAHHVTPAELDTRLAALEETTRVSVAVRITTLTPA